MLDLADIQSGALHPRPSPYVGTYILIRIDERQAGRETLKRLIPALSAATDPAHAGQDAWVSVALTFQGLKALGVPQDTLDSFPIEFQQGMAARAAKLGDMGESAPENWEKPLGTPDVHLGISAMSPDKGRLEAVLARAQKAYEQMPGISVIWRLDCYALPTDAEQFGFRDGISQPAIEGSGIPGTNPKEAPLKAGEFLLGYLDETNEYPPMPRPEILGRNGTISLGNPEYPDDDPQGFNHHCAHVNGIRLHYVEEGEGPLVILLHGYPFLWYLWRHQIKALAAAGYRAVALDQRGYGQTDCPMEVDSYDVTHLVGDVVGLMNLLESRSAVLVGQDWGSPVVYHAALMRPDLVRGVIMMCSPPSTRGAIRPSDGMKRLPKDINFYQSYLAQPEAAKEIERDLRRFLLGVFYSTSGHCPIERQWRWAWKSPETFSNTYTVPTTLPPYLSQQALDYYVDEFTRTGIRPANMWYAAIDRSWENTSFLDGAVVQQPALFLRGDRDPSLGPMFGIDRQGPALKSLKANFSNMREIITMPGVGHTPPEESPEEIKAIVFKFLKEISF